MVMLHRWLVYWKEKVMLGGQFNRGGLVMLERWSV